jgi:N-acetylglucosamine repressor
VDTADQNSIKVHNEKVILKTIIKHYPISRAKLSKLTELNKATVSLQAHSLITKSLVTEIGEGLSSGGRKPILLIFNKNAGFAIGVDLGVNYILTVLVDLEGNKIFSDCCKIENSSFKAVKPILIERIQLAASHAPESPYGIIGIGVGVHGFVNQDQTVLFTPHSKWKEIHLKKLLEENFNCPIFVDNEANAGAFGEKLYGGVKNFQSLIYVSVGVGIGLGIIVNDELYRGSNGFSGEMGHVTIDFNGKKCDCGNRGCWELYASENAFYHYLSRIKNGKNFTLEQVSKMIQENDGKTLMEIEKFGYFLGVGLTNIINTFNPEAIVIRSNLIEANPIILKSIEKAISTHTSRYVPQKQELFISQLQRNATALGAAAFMIDKFLVEPENFNLMNTENIQRLQPS